MRKKDNKDDLNAFQLAYIAEIARNVDDFLRRRLGTSEPILQDGCRVRTLLDDVSLNLHRIIKDYD